MKIGILGGMSAASSLLYYEKLIDMARQAAGGIAGPDVILRSLNFALIAPLMETGRWDEIGRTLNKEAKALEDQGADILVLATNTMHKLADQMMAGVSIPLLHIAEVTAQALIAQGRERPAFLATRFTMEEAFYLDALRKAGLEPQVPDKVERAEINRIIFEELCAGQILEPSQKTYLNIVQRLEAQGADSVVLGCTEICLLLNEDNCSLPVFDTTHLHCQAAMNATHRK